MAEKTLRQEWESFSKMVDGTVKVAIAQSLDMKKRTVFLKMDDERNLLEKISLSHKDGKIAKTHVVMKRNKKYLFQYGMVDLPAELSRDNFVGTYSQALLTGPPCTTQSAIMKMFGSTAGPTKPRSEYQFWNEKKQRYSVLPRNFVSSREGKRGKETLKLRCVHELVKGD